MELYCLLLTKILREGVNVLGNQGESCARVERKAQWPEEIVPFVDVCHDQRSDSWRAHLNGCILTEATFGNTREAFKGVSGKFC
ncbi:hypothetical protein AVEN_82056-1 [Araneus ventricosus]|uniref:Uncharacterized protein n=1 Tax=Araneus ventricosus TaxID=182803 RepID=A0A4Y2T0W1_ARAVE|nr:hypothetical protein AVEN_82056-1 [Araneus ventricosus]